MKIDADKKIIILSILTGLFLIYLEILNAVILDKGLVLDAGFSLVVVAVMLLMRKRLHQTPLSFFLFCFTIVLHNLALYATSPLGIRFDHYMHFVAGFTIAIMADALFFEKMSKKKRAFVIIMIGLGIGSIGEITEWAGYGILGKGEGFFLFGSGDEGEWRNSILDMFFNGAGAVAAAILVTVNSAIIARKQRKTKILLYLFDRQ